MKQDCEVPGFRIDGKVAIITGAAGLLGEQHATALASHGADLVLVDLDAAACSELADRVSLQFGTKAIGIRGDVASRDSWLAVRHEAVETFGRIDVLVNNAAFTNQSQTPSFSASFEDFPLDDWAAILDVNLTGTFLGCQVVGRQMLEQGEGSIINVASLYGVVSPHHRIYDGTGICQPVAYSVSKGGVIALTRYLGALWAERGVKVNCITPGGVFNNHTDEFTARYSKLSPIGRMADRREMSGAVVFLASNASAYCAGHNLVVDGGWTVW